MSGVFNAFLFRLLVFTAACFLLHYLLQWYVLSSYTFYLTTWHIYLFLTPLTLVGYYLLLVVHRRDNAKTGFAFVAIGFLKMLAAVIFLYPMIASGYDHLFIQVLSFFIPYFLFLGFDTYFTIDLLSKK